MQIVLDEDSFTQPFMEAFDHTAEALVASGRSILGASARAEAAKRDLDDLRAFKTEIAQRLRDENFSDLPALRARLRRIEHCHHLTVGPWKGIFLLDPEGDMVVGLIFSKAPHNYISRLPELMARHTGCGEDEG